MFRSIIHLGLVKTLHLLLQILQFAFRLCREAGLNTLYRGKQSFLSGDFGAEGVGVGFHACFVRGGGLELYFQESHFGGSLLILLLLLRQLSPHRLQMTLRLTQQLLQLALPPRFALVLRLRPLQRTLETFAFSSIVRHINLQSRRSGLVRGQIATEPFVRSGQFIGMGIHPCQPRVQRLLLVFPTGNLRFQGGHLLPHGVLLRLDLG
mmetsp:Transcript_24712/g.44386  ORF Transcript_24712/g.44386 Transcript_24712/m.44386 type:complete len:208 (+) Transcript_24712:3828-4451(+)